MREMVNKMEKKKAKDYGLAVMILSFFVAILVVCQAGTIEHIFNKRDEILSLEERLDDIELKRTVKRLELNNTNIILNLDIEEYLCTENVVTNHRKKEDMFGGDDFTDHFYASTYSGDAQGDYGECLISLLYDD